MAKLDKKNIKFGFFNDLGKGYSELVDFKPELLGRSDKKDEEFIQVVINNQDYIRVGRIWHPWLLRHTLDDFRINYNIRDLDEPLPFAGNYNLVGAGEIRLIGDKLNFYHRSKEYLAHVWGTDVKQLQRFFGQENVAEGESVKGYPSYFVNYQGFPLF